MRYLFFFIAIFLFACQTSDNTNNPSNPAETTEVLSGAELYKTYCVACHGMDGTLAFSGATNLQTSTLTLDQRIFQISNGKGAMSPFKGIMTETEIEKVAEYISTLRK